jgi:arsenate reductase (thioredoxin)
MKTVIFACVHNAGRSQMAAAWLRQLSDPRRVNVVSAGTEPAMHVHQVVAETMLEVGIDVSAAHPQKLTEELVERCDFLITMGCGEACPIAPPHVVRIDWPLEDPKGKSVERVREIRDDIRKRVAALIADRDL